MFNKKGYYNIFKVFQVLIRPQSKSALGFNEIYTLIPCFFYCGIQEHVSLRILKSGIVMSMR